MRYRVEHENIKFISMSGHVIFCLLYKLTYDDIDYFPKLSDHFPEISEDFPKFVQRPDERSRTFSEDFRGFPKIAEEDPIMFRSYSKTSEYFLGDYVAKATVIMLSSRVKICYLHMWRYEVFAWKLTWYFTGVYIIKVNITPYLFISRLSKLS